jgi:cytoskeletal protein RodZ
MIAAEEQINIFLEHFLVQTTNVRKDYIIFTVILVITYIICYIVYIYFLEQVEHRKKSYLAIFYEIGKGFILSSLSKCEHFSQKLQLEKKIESNNNHTQSFSSSSFIDKLDESQNFDMNIISTNISSNLRKEFASQISKEKKKQNKNVLATNKNFYKNKNIKLLVIFFCIFSCLAMYICIVFIFALLLSKDFDNFT